MLTRFKIAHKIYLLGAIQFFLIAIIGWIGYSQMAKIGEELKEITTNDIPLANSLGLLTEHKLEQSILFERALLEGVFKAQGSQKYADKFVNTSEAFLTLSKKIEVEIQESIQFLDNSIEHLHSKAAIEEFKTLSQAMRSIEASYLLLEEENQQVLAIIDSGDITAAKALIPKIETHEDEVDKHLKDTFNEIQVFTLHAAQKAQADEEKGIQIIKAGIIISLILGIALPILIAKSITKPIKKLTNRLNEISHGDGDLSMRLDDSGGDETADAAASLNTFMQKLTNTICFINDSADSLNSSSENAIRVMEKTLSNVQNQRDETTMVSSAMEEMRTATQHVAQNTAEAAKVAESAKNRVGEGKIAAIDTQEIIRQLANEMDNASSVIEALAEETDNIGNVLEAIRGIAEQTNLLALNAAIEAARAGDTGRGFAVVADEVRSLAQRTQSSTGDIQTLVENLQSEAKNAVSSMKKGSESTVKCLEKSNETANALEDASQAVHSISDLNTQIASTAEEQSAAAEQIKDSVSNISSIANQTSEGTAETASANQDIAKDILDLRTSLAQFKI